MHFAIVIEKAENNYASYVPDLLGCVATGKTFEETEQQIREAIGLHFRRNARRWFANSGAEQPG